MSPSSQRTQHHILPSSITLPGQMPLQLCRDALWCNTPTRLILTHLQTTLQMPSCLGLVSTTLASKAKTLLPIDTRPVNSQSKAKEASLRASTSWWWRGIVEVLAPVPWVRLHGTSGDQEPGDVASKFRKDSWLRGDLLTDIRSTQLSSEKGSPQLLFSIHWLTRSFITAHTTPLMTKQGPAGLTKLETHQTNLYSLV